MGLGHPLSTADAPCLRNDLHVMVLKELRETLFTVVPIVLRCQQSGPLIELGFAARRLGC
ncbi:hypothetical protein PanWU01x14_366310 [Parasponia andersonii]|uniref:Uncharacterized protein n=1 Tax=Parasponia andersonii TaxID=3476 RepID=A0A2P5A5N2_PARAD|nr:hypothetical protein PanWU01x14_366310 [Parasponia andersonii]